jgi:hypothetical protein
MPLLIVEIMSAPSDEAPTLWQAAPTALNNTNNPDCLLERDAFG